MAVSLYTSRVVLATLGVDDFGLNVVVTSAITIFLFLNSSMAGATSRFLTFALGKNDFEKLKKTFSAALTIHIVIALIILLLGETIGLWYLENKMVIPEGRMTAARWVYHLSLASAMITITQVPYNASIIAYERMNVYAYIEIFKTVLLLGIVYLLVIGNFDKLILYAILTLCVSIVITFIYRFYCIKHFGECRYKFEWDKKITRPILSFSLWDLFGNFSLSVKDKGVNIVLNLFYAASVNAAFGIAHQVSAQVTSLASNLITASKPQIIKYYADNNIKQMQILVNNISKFSFLILFAICLPVILEIDFILNLWLKEVPVYTGIFAQLFLVSGLFGIIMNNFNAPIHATGKIKSVTWKISIVQVSVPLVSYFLLKAGGIPVYMPVVIINIGVIVVLIIRLLAVHHLIPEFSIPDFLRKSILPIVYVALPAVILPLFCHYHIAEGWIRLILVTLSSLFSVCILTGYLAMSKEQRMKAIHILKQKIKR